MFKPTKIFKAIVLQIKKLELLLDIDVFKGKNC